MPVGFRPWKITGLWIKVLGHLHNIVSLKTNSTSISMLAVEDGVRDPVWVTAGQGLEIGALSQSCTEYLVATSMSRPLERASAEDEPLGDLTPKGPSLNKFSKNPWVPAGAILTAAVLAGGIAAFQRGNVIWSQRMMRARVAAQGATILILAASVGMFQNSKPNNPS